MLNNQEIKAPLLIKVLNKRFPFENSKFRMTFGLYECFCGKEFEAGMPRVKSGHVSSCGCLSHQKLMQRNLKHGLRQHKLYGHFTDMRTRCNNPNSTSYDNYGGRGIQICSRWVSFQNFYDDMFPTWEEGLSLDRINVNGNYEPSNCRWATKEVQGRNCQKIRSNNKSGYKGVSYSKKENIWICQITINSKTIKIGRFKDVLEGAKAYDSYVINHNLEHTINGVLFSNIT